ncbi:MAG: acetylxylan esterase [Lentisphaerae bacterium]|nr:acetylxylan esterase [Lentisphaerota bacterium]
MKKYLLLLSLFTVSVLAALEITPEKDQHYRRIDDEVIFHIQLDPGRGNCTFPVLVEGNRDIRSSYRISADKDGKATISVPALRSGFIYVQVSDNGKKAAAAVAVEPENIRPGRDISRTFRNYWTQVKREFDIQPVRYQINELPNAKAGFKAFEVKLLLGGEGKDGFAVLTMPAKAVPGRCAARIIYQPAGVDYARPAYFADTLTLVVNPLPIKHNGANMSQTIKPDGKFFRYWNWGANDLQKNCFPDMLKRAYRFVQFMKSLPEWDQRTLVVFGRSQGGAQALAVTGLDPQITMCVAYVPALCDHGGFAAGNRSGWPHYYRLKEYQDDPDKSLALTDIIDVSFFAAGITGAEVVVSCGFIDTTCPPESVYAAYNMIESENKQMIDDLHSTHSTPKSTYDRGEALISGHIRKMQESIR